MKKNLLLIVGLIVMGTVCSAQDPGAVAGNTGLVLGTYRGSNISYTTVRAKDGWVWLQQNLGSTQVATASADAAAYGDLFQWGRWDDGHQERNPGNTMNSHAVPNNPSGLNLSGNNPFYYGGGITWYNDGAVSDRWTAPLPASATASIGCDPCKQIFGGEWHLPTLADWQAMCTAEGITNLNTGFNSTVKLPAAGARNEISGLLDAEGVGGVYWSATPEPGSAPQAMYINLTQSNFADFNFRGIGMSLRCMKKTLATSIKDKKMGSNFKFYPNPAMDFITIVYPLNVRDNTIQIKDMMGRVCYQQVQLKQSNIITVPVDMLADGMYLLSDATQVHKLVIARN